MKTEITHDDVKEWTESSEIEGLDELERKVVRKIDLRLLPYLSLMYLFSSLDRGAIGNSKVVGIDKDVGLIDNQWNIVLTIFYIGFVLFEIPSNIVLKHTSAKIWLPTIMLLWGLSATLTILAKNFTGLLTVRFFLGMFEAGFFPGVVYYLSTFYKRSEMASRISIFWGSTTLASSFTGLVSYRIFQIEGDLRPWQYLFLIEGLLTMLVAVGAYFILPVSASHAPWLNEQERVVAVQRIARDSSAPSENQFNLQDALSVFTDWKIGVWGLIGFSLSVPMNSVGLFLPSIISEMGHDPISTQLLTVPQFTLATMIMVPYCWHSDLHQERTYHYLGSGLVCTLGFILLAVISNHSIQYFATFFAVIGSYPQSVILHAWYANNIPQPSRRAVAVGLIVSMSNAAGFLASNIYRNQDKPRYVFGHVVCASFAFIGCTLTVLLSAYLKRENRRRDKIQGIAVKLQGVDASELQDHGDENVAYRYVT